MKRFLLLLLALAAFCPAAAPLAAQVPSDSTASQESALAARADEIVQLINGEIEPEAVFTEGFLAQVPAAQFKAISQQLTSQFGRALAVESLDPPTGTQAAIAIRMERAVARGSIAIDPAAGNRVTGLLFRSFDPVDDSKAKIEAEISALPGTVSVWMGPLDGGAPAISVAPDRALALGSTFKLYVLATLAEQIAEGKRQWSDVVALDSRSFPSGQMQNWPQGAPVTLHTLASLMISISDNTATDQLIKVLGRDTVLDLLRRTGHSDPALDSPFLMTREMFLLKGGDPARLEAYRSGDDAKRRAILDSMTDERPATDLIERAFLSGPKAIDVEWLASGEDLARLLRHMRRTADPEAFRIMAINPSATPAIREKWAYVGFKGGSEPGVLNFTWLLTDKAGRDHALVMTWNNPDAPVDQTAFELLGQRLLALSGG
ncbi:MAG: serine hydrolase [Porphyrobacter sp.]|nr:serine hydrolase [Porphyrobacter sp.]